MYTQTKEFPYGNFFCLGKFIMINLYTVFEKNEELCKNIFIYMSINVV